MKKSHLIITAVIGGAFCFITAYAGGMKIFGGDSPAESIATTAVTDVGGGDNEGFVRRKYPGCRILDRDTDDGLVEIKIRHEGKEKIVLFDGGGKWLRTLWDVRRTGLPEWALSVMERIGFTFKNVDDNDNQAVETPDGLFYAIQAERNDRTDRIYIVSRRGVASQYTDDEWADGRLHGRNFRFGGYDDGEDRFDEGDDEWDDRHKPVLRRHRDDGEDRFDKGDDEWDDRHKPVLRRHRDDGEDRFDEGDDEWDDRHKPVLRRHRDDGEDHFDEGDDEWD